MCEKDKELNKLKEILLRVRTIVCEAAEEGFNPHKGTWAQDLFTNNGVITKALETNRKRITKDKYRWIANTQKAKPDTGSKLIDVLFSDGGISGEYTADSWDADDLDP